MDASDFENMLFGITDSQDVSNEAFPEDSDEDILFPDIENEPILWDLSNDQLLTSPTSSPGRGELTNTDFYRHDSAQPQQQQKEHMQKPVRDRHWVIARIEAMLEKIVDGLLEEHEALTITLKSRATLSRRRTIAAEGDGRPPAPKERDINFPGASAQEAWNFTVLLRILELIHGGLIDNTVMTKRDIYYRHPDLFVKQTVVDRYVDDLACTFGITRSQLNVTAAAKGLVAGNFTLNRENGHRVNGMNDKEGMLVPIIGENDTLELTSVHWILVIEKEATFRSLMSSPQWERLGSYGVILTAKGYPDISSRRFLRQLADHAPYIPMYAFVDLDPDGIAILSTYKYGSYRLAHEDVTSSDAPALSLPNICWLGLKSAHLARPPVFQDGSNKATTPLHLQGLMKLTARDRTKAQRMLEWDLCTEDGPEQGWRQELQKMLMCNVKAEMQILDELPGRLVSWLSGQLEQGKETEKEKIYARNIDCEFFDADMSDDGMLF